MRVVDRSRWRWTRKAIDAREMRMARLRRIGERVAASRAKGRGSDRDQKLNFRASTCSIKVAARFGQPALEDASGTPIPQKQVNLG